MDQTTQNESPPPQNSSQNSSQVPPQNSPQKKTHSYQAIISLFFNIIIPTLILSKLSKKLGEDGPLIALFVALAFPLGYGLYEYFIEKKKSFLSVIGLASILLTGGLALLKLEGTWFALKEASIPLIIGIYVFISSFTKKPLMGLLIFNEGFLNRDQIEPLLKEKNLEHGFENLLKQSTIYLSFSFVFSAILNFVLAEIIFVPIDLGLPEIERAQILNDQMAQMNWKSYFVIALPSLVLTFGVLFYFIKKLEKMLDMDFQALLDGQK